MIPTNKRLEKKIDALYREVFAKIYNDTRMKELSKGNRSSILRAAGKIENSKVYNEFAEEFSKELAKIGLQNQRGVWRKYFKAAKKLHYVGLPKTFSEYEKQVYAQAIQHNFQMIKSIPQEALKIMEHKYTNKLIKEVAMNKLPRGSFQKMLESHGAKNAKVIARTESAKLLTSITQQRAQAVGSVAYTWRSSNDRRTRPSHKKMQGVIVFWRPDEQKPLLDKMRGNAGEFPNCRCDTLPIVDVDYLTKPSYKVYDYRNDTIITMTKNQIKESILKGELS